MLPEPGIMRFPHNPGLSASEPVETEHGAQILLGR
jgi:hypothetical protein